MPLTTTLESKPLYVQAGSALTSFATNGGRDARIYYLDSRYRVDERAWANGAFVNSVLPGAAVPGSDLACFGTNGGVDPRVYYLDSHYRVNELAWVNSRFVNSVLPGVAVPGSALTCFGTNGGVDPRVYYLDSQYRVNELARVNGRFVNSVLPGAAIPGSALACFGITGGMDARVYYLDSQYRVNELASVNGRFLNNAISSGSRPAIGISGSALACLGLAGMGTRLYHLNLQHRIVQLAWVSGQFISTTLPGTAIHRTPLTCLSTLQSSGEAPRVFYLDSNCRLNELLSLDGDFTNNIL